MLSILKSQGTTKMDITQLLALSIKEGASDSHLSAGLPPILRIDGDLVRMDLPVLKPKQVAELIHELKKQGLGIFLIEHDIHNVMKLCDRASVMKNGRLVGTERVEDVTEDDILSMIILGKNPKQAA